MDMRTMRDVIFYTGVVLFIIFVNTNNFLNGPYKQQQCSRIEATSSMASTSFRIMSPIVENVTHTENQSDDIPTELAPAFDMSKRSSGELPIIADINANDPLYREGRKRYDACVQGIDFSKNDWFAQAEAQQKCVFNRYHGTIPKCVIKGWRGNNLTDHSYSKVYFNETDGLNWGYFKNACYNMKTQHIELYRKTSTPFVPKRILGFQHLWVYDEFESPLPESYQMNIGMNAWMIIPGWTRHTSHFSQNIFWVNHRNAHPDWYPPMDALFMPNFQMAREIKFNKVLSQMLMSSASPDHNITFYGKESMLGMTVDNRVCFDYLGVSGHIGHHGAGGYFYQLFESDLFRAYAYKYYNLRPQSRLIPRARLNVLFLKRNPKSKGRQLLNSYDIKNAIARRPYLYSYKEELIDSYPMETQVQMTMETDIMIAVHGAAMATIVFMLPHSAVIELRPPYFRDNWYHVLCTAAKLIPIIHNNFSIPLPAACPSPDVTLIPAKYKACWLAVHYQDFTVDFLYLRELIEYAYRQVVHYKYHL
ncbi:hypothetical protein WA158_002889 [Blastocystis sp. Blastoise]